MHSRGTVATWVALLGAAALTTTACAGGASGGDQGGTDAPASGADGASGGTLYYLTKRNAEHLDPQRINSGRDMSNMGRMVYRTLTAFAVASDDGSDKVVPDLATGTGKSSDGAKTWAFTLKSDVRWQDGSAITCADVKYGVSRTFATDVITGGANNAIQYLDIPSGDHGSNYQGPYDSTPAQQKLFDRAVECQGKTITFHLKRPVADFNKAVTRLGFAPYKESQDHGDKSNYAVFSSGPYKIEGSWASGGTTSFERNGEWDVSTDTVRRALPAKLVFTEGLTDEVIAQRLISDNGKDRFAVTDRSVPPALQARAVGDPEVKARTTNPKTPFVEYLLPNFAGDKMRNPLVRQALAISTNKEGYLTALGGPTMGELATAIISPNAPGFKKFSPFDAPDSGDPARAKKLLAKAGVSSPYPITYIYSGGTSSADKAAAALKNTWDQAGFKITLQPETQNYFSIVQDPQKADTWDVCWMNWGADWPGGSTIIPPLWDSRVNLSAKSNGADLGAYKSDAVNAAIDDAQKLTDTAKQDTAWGDIDASLAKDAAYVPLVVDKFFLVRGSAVTGFGNAEYPELATIGLKG